MKSHRSNDIPGGRLEQSLLLQGVYYQYSWTPRFVNDQLVGRFRLGRRPWYVATVITKRDAPNLILHNHHVVAQHLICVSEIISLCLSTLLMYLYALT
jgi:hypothetical protein